MARGRVLIREELLRSLGERGSFLICVSGGVDSVVLLHSCAQLSRERDYTFEVAHVDHGLRSESSQDAAFVEKLSQLFGFSFHHLRALQRKRGENIEAWGRRVRYSFFQEVCVARNLDYALTAHTANDVAETFLMRLVANKDSGTLSRRDERRKILRPLLSVPRAEIERYAAAHRLEWREDVTNADPAFLRNRIRHELIPLLQERFDRRIIETLSDRARYFSAVDNALLDEVKPTLDRLGERTFGGKEWLRELRQELSGPSEARHSKLVEELFLPHLGYRLGFKKALLVRDFILGERVGMQLPSGVRLARTKGGLSIRKGG